MRWILVLLCFACAGPKDQVILLDSEGALTITMNRQQIDLTESYTTARVDKTRITKGTISPKQVEERYGEVLRTLPEAERIFTVYFETGKAEIAPEILAEIIAEIKSRGVVELEITGYTDQVGGQDENAKLSLERANKVYTLLLDNGIEVKFVRLLGMGMRNPVIDNPGKSEEKNRRVNVLIR